MFYLFKNPNNEDWMWLNSTTGDLVYMQTYETKKKTRAWFFPRGLTQKGSSSYDFQLFNCMN